MTEIEQRYAISFLLKKQMQPTFNFFDPKINACNTVRIITNSIRKYKIHMVMMRTVLQAFIFGSKKLNVGEKVSRTFPVREDQWMMMLII